MTPRYLPEPLTASTTAEGRRCQLTLQDQRIGPELKAKLATAAHAEGRTVAAWVIDKLLVALEPPLAESTFTDPEADPEYWAAKFNLHSTERTDRWTVSASSTT